MKVITFYKKNAEKFLFESGYDTSKHGCILGGYVFETEKGRFHAFLEGKDDNTIKLHFDTTINGFHRVFPNASKLTKEKNRIIKKQHRVVKNDNCYYCINCQKASGDGDGLVGKKCNLVP